MSKGKATKKTPVAKRATPKKAAPAKPRTAKAPVGPKVARGVDLVEAVIAESEPGTHPLSAGVIAALRFEGHAAPPSLARWLAHDGHDLGWFDPRVEGRLPRLSLSQAADLALSGGAMVFGDMDEVFPGACYPIHDEELDAGERFHFLYAGKPTVDGELPVLCADMSDSGTVGLAAPGMDVYLAQRAGILERTAFAGACPPGMETAWKAHVKHNLGKRPIVDALEYLDNFDGYDTEVLTKGAVVRAYAYGRAMGVVAAWVALEGSLGDIVAALKKGAPAKTPDGGKLTRDGGKLSYRE